MIQKHLTKTKQRIKIEVSLLEAAMIFQLRKYDYGEFRIIKISGDPIRIIIEGSEILKEADGLQLEFDKKNESML